MKFAVIEDERVIAERLERLSREILGGRVESMKLLMEFEDAREYLQRVPVDVVLLDLNLNGQDGFRLLQEAVAGAFHTIVVSANVDRALAAFEYGVLDFVPKPFSRARLAQAFARLSDARSRADYGARYLAVAGVGEVRLVEVEDLLWAEGSGSYSELVLRDGTRELHNKTLDRLLAVLPPSFERIHKSFIANMGEAVRLHSSAGSRYALELRCGERLPVGRSRYKSIREKLR